MTSDGTHSYSWNARNQLSTIDAGTTASFTYDPLGRRISKSISGTTTSFLYDGANAVQEVIGGTNTANSLTGGIDEIFQRTDSAGARIFLTDALGSAIALADSTGTLQSQYSFDPFGNTTVNGGPTTNSFAYTGRELDATGLYFSRARYYDPQIERFISEDPLKLIAGVNSFAYVLNNPTNLVDPLGLLCKLSPFDRIKLAGLGAFHIGLGIGKITTGAAATVATDGLAAPLLIYAVPSGVGNYASGTFELIAALVGDQASVETLENASQTAGAVTTFTGLGTLIATGDFAAATRNAQIEGLFTGALGGGLKGGMDAVDLADTGENIYNTVKKP
jgi:RHS repeat-associated protein